MEVDRSKKDDHVVVTIDLPNTNTSKQSPQADQEYHTKNNNNNNNQIPVPRAKTLRRLNFSKPRSRFEETTHHLLQNHYKTIPESEELTPLNPHDSDDNPSSSDDERYNDDDKYKKGRGRRLKKINKRVVIEWTLFLIIMTCLLCAVIVEPLKHKKKWSLEIWKWCVMIMVLFCGRLVAGWVVLFAVFLIERNFMLKEKVLYFVYGLRKSFQNCAWLGLVLIAWTIMFPDVHKHNKVLKKVFRFLIAVLIGATIWLLKILLVKVLASSFHVATFFDRMKESVFHHYILDALSSPALEEEEPRQRRRLLQGSKSLPARLRERTVSGADADADAVGGSGRRGIDMERLKKLSMQSRPTAWSVRRLVCYVRSSGLSTISRTVDDFGTAESEITSEWGARNCAKRIFKNVAKPDAK